MIRFFSAHRLLFLLLLISGFALRWIYAGTWLWEGRPVFVDADCYTRMARVAQILEGKALFFQRHSFENFPQGISTHTTFPLDALLVIGSKFFSFLSANPMDWAGAWIGPILFALLITFAAQKSRALTMDPWVLLPGIAFLPCLVWATPFARPDHQALLITLLGIAWMLEPQRWHSTSIRIPLVAGLLWGLSLWTSWFEPGILLGILLVFNGFYRRREQPWFLGGITLPLVLQGLTEGYHLDAVSRLDTVQLAPWFQTIGELRPMGFIESLFIFTPFLLLIPFALLQLSQRNALTREVILWGILFLALLFLSLLQRRWMYFTGLPMLFLIARWNTHLQPSLQKILRGALLISCLVGAWKVGWNPSSEAPLTVEARQVSRSIQTSGSILAPWWISPALLYYSGQPIVSSSSHESYEGILDSALFFTTHSWPEALSLLDSRQVRWVVVYDAERLLLNSRQILRENSQAPMMGTIAGKLWSTLGVSSKLHLRAVTPNLRLYEYIPQ